MANVKISALPAATSALVTDEFPINQGGTTKKLTLDQIKSVIGGGTTTNTTNVTLSGFDPNTAECDSTLVWDCNLKRFVATKTPQFITPPAKSAIKFLGYASAAWTAVIGVTYDNRIIYWGHDQNTIGNRNKVVAPQNYVRLKLLNNNGTTPTYDDYLSLEANKNVNIVDVQYGRYGMLALLSDNTVWLNGNGGEAKGNWQISSTNPLASTYTRGYLLKVQNPSGAKYTKISYGGENDKTYFNCMLLTDDKNVYVFGSNQNGMCGAGVTAGINVDISNMSSKISNTNIAGKAKDIFSGSGEYGVSYILTDTDQLWAAGYNGEGQLGQNDLVAKNTFVKISDNVKTFAKSPYGCYRNTFFIKTDGTIWGCGNNVTRQLNTGNATAQKVPVQITSVGENFVKIEFSSGNAANISVIAMTDQGKVYTWGYNGHGACGNGTNVVVTTPTLVNNPKTSQPLLAKDIYASKNYNSGNCFYIIGQDNMIYAAGYRAWTSSTGVNPSALDQANHRWFYPFSVNIERDAIKNFNVIDVDHHYGMFLTTSDGHLFYKGVSNYNQGSIVTDDITEFSYVM